jgi:DNA-binding transcriptional regulator PaaX
MGMSSSKEKYSKKILKKLVERPAIPVEEITTPLPLLHKEGKKNSYALSRALKNLVEGGYAEIHKTERKNYAKITAEGKTKLNSMTLEGGDALIPQTWDGLWRIILLDLPENRKNERGSLRYLLKKAGFVCLKNSAWISPFPFEHLFTNIKRDLGLTTELMIIVTEFIDEESKKVIFETFGK